MIALLKTFGKGILYVIGFPFFLVALILFAVFGLGAFVFQLIRSIIFFFTGQRFFPELPEDKELRLMLHPEQAAEETPVVEDTPKEEKVEESPILEAISTSEPVQEEVAPAPQTVQPQTIEDAVFVNTAPINNVPQEPVNNIQQEPVNNVQPEPVNNNDPFASLLINEEPKQAPQPEPETIARFCPYCGSRNVIGANQRQYQCFSCRHDVDVPVPMTQQQSVIDTTVSAPSEPEPKKEEILEVYTPRTNTYVNTIEGEEETDNNGVTIDFDN